MYLVDTTVADGIRCETIDDVKKLRRDIIKKVYVLHEVDYDSLVSTQDIREAVYACLKGKQLDKDDVIDAVTERLGVKRSDVSKVTTQMRKEKILYKVSGFPWIGID